MLSVASATSAKSLGGGGGDHQDAALQQQVVDANGGGGVEADDEDDEAFFQDIELLQNHGINVADLKKLKAVGVCTIKGAQMMTKKRLCAIKGLSEAKVDKIKEAVAKMFAGAAFCTALQVSPSLVPNSILLYVTLVTGFIH